MGPNPIFKDIGNPCTVRAIQISGGMLFQMTREKVCFQGPIRWLIERLEHPYSSQCYLMGRKHWRNVVSQIMKSSSMKDFISDNQHLKSCGNQCNSHSTDDTWAFKTSPLLPVLLHSLLLTSAWNIKTKSMKSCSLRVRSYMKVYNMAVREFWHTLLCFKKEGLHSQYKEWNFVF